MPYEDHAHDVRHIASVLTILHTLHIITTLTLLVLLVWHISTVDLVEHFDMPRSWERTYKKNQLNSWRSSVWALVFALVPVDLGCALWCLGRVHSRMNEDEEEIWEQGKEDDNDIGAREEKVEGLLPGASEKKREWRMWMARQDPNSKIKDDTSTARPSTAITHETSPIAPSIRSNKKSSKHSALASHRYLYSFLAHTVFHIVAITFYTTHVVFYATSLQPSFKTCYNPIIFDEWARHILRYPEQKLSFRDRCKRINWSIWVAGGFQCAGALIMGLLHIATFGTRLWDCFGRYLKPSEESGGENDVWTGDRAGSEKKWDFGPRDVDVKPRAVRERSERAVSSGAMSTDSQGESGLRRRKDSKTGPNVKSESKSDGSDGTWKVDAAWNEALLECLIP
ncbi:hypothetical protein T440DRAFT_536349 [Plenodomus tracheiphilus IPT5]|uniref:Uncharacterized protein n=1 Tax=Plenodomus tracheiphilus IPT5 TaxID=1408161 RepID=A0A6A7B2F6_9PLEO|nr:hypothetical protein T440DRAFT_536349 [Plenodomus tracheiphilus IPT5]